MSRVARLSATAQTFGLSARGLSQLAPTGSFDGLTLTAPIHPMSDPTAGIGLPGFSVTEHTSDPHDPLDRFKERGR